MKKTKLHLHHPIGISETRKGLSLAVSDLLRKTSAQNLEALELNSKLVDMFKNGLTEVEEEKLLDFLPLRTSRYRDITDIELGREEAREYIRDQYESYQKGLLAAEQRRRAAAFRETQYMQQRMQQQTDEENFDKTPARSNVMPDNKRRISIDGR